VLCHEWAHALAWNYSPDRLARTLSIEPAEFDRASHDEAWGCAYSRVWRAYQDVIREVSLFASLEVEDSATWRRPSDILPAMRRHTPTNTARINIGGKVHSLGRAGSAIRAVSRAVPADFAGLGRIGSVGPSARGRAGAPIRPFQTIDPSGAGLFHPGDCHADFALRVRRHLGDRLQRYAG
jgi:hypothetical protein